MSHVLLRWMRARDKGPKKPISKEERRALFHLRREAKQHGSKLKNKGKGGLSSSLALHVMRRDQYCCKVCGGRGTDDGNGLTLHHKGGIVESKWLSRQGHKDAPNNLVTICDRCHNRIHEEAKLVGVDSTQITPEGDR